MYGLLFSEELKGYDYWGWLNPHVMLGDVRKFITDDILNEYDIISGKGRQIAGHNCILKNTDVINNLFKHKNLYIDTLKTTWYENFFEENTFTTICKENEINGNIKCLFRSHCAPYGDYVWENGKVKQLKEVPYCGDFYSIGNEYLYTHYMGYKGMGNTITDRKLHLKNANISYNDNKISKIEILETKNDIVTLGDDFYYSRNQKVWLISVTEDYFDKAKYLIKSLNQFSKYKVLLYTINFETDFECDNLIKRYLNIPNITNDLSKKTPQDKFIFMSARLKAIVDAIDNGWEEIVFLDSDMIANENVDELFDEMMNVTNAPILVEGYYQYNLYRKNGVCYGNPFTEIDGQQLCDNKKALEYPLQKRLGLHEDDRTHNRQAGVMIFNKNCRKFFTDCIDIAFDKNIIENWEQIAPWHDETIMNVMLWKYKFNYMLPYQFVDTRQDGVSIVRDFFEKEHLTEKEYSPFTKIPKQEDKKNIRFFHGARDLNSIKEIYEYVCNKKSVLPQEAYITHVSKEYLPIVEYTIKSLQLFSNKKIILYTINCDAEFEYPNLIKRRLDIEGITEPKKIKDNGDGDSFYVDRQDPSVYKFLTLKPKILLDALSNGVETGIYIDADSLCNENIDSLFSYEDSIKNYPLLTDGIFEFIGWNGKFHIENTLMDKLNISRDKRTWYRQTGYILFNKKCNDFIKEWDSLCEDDRIISDWNNLAPYHEETIINVLFWKYEYNDRLPRCYINILSDKTIDYFFDCELEWDEEWRGSQLLPNEKVGSLALNNDRFLMLPKHKHQVKFFHGLKNTKDLEKSYQYLKRKKTRLLYIIPHLSTGGLPQVSLKRIELMKDEFDVHAICYEDAGRHWFVVQKNKINDILGNRIIYLSDDKEEKTKQLFNHIEKVNPHIIHLEELPEDFMNINDAKMLYKNNRNYKLVETCHTSQYNWSSKKFKPDKFSFISKLHAIQSKDSKLLKDIPNEVIEYPVEYKDRPNRKTALLDLNQDPNYKHVLMVGLFTSGKNQKEIFDVASKMIDEKIMFHFVGNLALNFKDYWGKFISDNLEELPQNIVVWNEQHDVDRFYSAFDLFYFSSKLECNPLVVKEALGWKLPILMYNLDSYCGSYDNTDNIYFINGDIDNTINLITNILEIKDTTDNTIVSSDWMGI